MMSSLYHLAQELLALALCDLFPGTWLVEGEIDEVGFSYEVQLPSGRISHFGPRELELVEDRMHALVLEKKEIKSIEMMRENAVIYLDHLGQPLLAEGAALAETNIVSLIQIGNFCDLSPPLEALTTGELKAFKLLHAELLAGGRLRIWGTAGSHQGALKEQLKKIKQAAKQDPAKLAPQLGYGEKGEGGEWIWHSQGEALLWKLQTLWRRIHLKKSFMLVVVPPSLSMETTHQALLEQKKGKKVASFRLYEGDLATVEGREGELLEASISSLQFFGQLFKIFPFEVVIHFSGPSGSILARALAHLEAPFEREEGEKQRQRAAFFAFDGYGRKKLLSSIEVEEGKGRMCHRLFAHFGNWMALCIEGRITDFEFEG